jgi:fructan beta-fructosidase
MIRYLMMAFLLVVSLATYPKKKASNPRFNETYRNQIHFSPEVNRMGSPIALWKTESTYHLYYQYNPHNLSQGFFNWGHATSTDLVHWEHRGVVIEQPSTETDSMMQSPWWGSVHANEQGITAWVNRWDKGVFKVSSSDGFKFGEEMKCNGVDHLLQSDPYVFWHKPTNKWVMVAYNRQSKSMHILNSGDGINWVETSEFNYSFGFPQLIEMPVDRKPDESRWVLFTDGGTYMVGAFDGETFEIENTVKLFDHGRSAGGTVFYVDAEREGAVTLSSIKSPQQADMASNGILSFPTIMTLNNGAGGLAVSHRPIREIEALYSKHTKFEERKIYPGLKNNLLRKVKGSEIYIKGSINILSSDHYGFLVRVDRDKRGTEVSYNHKRNFFTVINTQFNYTPVDNKIDFEMLIDRSSIEIFIDGGRYVCRSPFTPKPKANGYELFTSGGEILVNWLEVHYLKPIW